MMKARKFDKDFRALLGMEKYVATELNFQMSIKKKSVIVTDVFSNADVFEILTTFKNSLNYFLNQFCEKLYCS